jgi:hypothetical protein
VTIFSAGVIPGAGPLCVETYRISRRHLDELYDGESGLGLHVLRFMQKPR